MKNLLFFLCLSAILWRCDSKTANTAEQSESTEEVTEQVIDNQETETLPSDKIKSLDIKNPSDYSTEFIKALRQQPIGDAILDGNKFILDGESMEFPEYPKMNKYTVLTAKKDNVAIAMKVKRINQTTIEYEIEMSGTETTKGQATISATSMYLGSESDENERSGISYEAYEYVDTKDDCFTYIRIGKEDETPYLLGRLIKNCNGDMDDIDLDFGMFTEK